MDKISYQKHSIATIASHSALQILKGARDEGFKTIAICKKEHLKFYKSFNVADKYFILDSFKDFFKVEKDLIKNKAIIIPHGSFVAYLGPKQISQMKVMHYGNKNILRWESDRELEREWLSKAGLRLPRVFKTPEEIDCLSIIKFHGAQGGQDYFLVKNKTEFYEKIKQFPNKQYQIQEYIIGVPVYIHYFYSPLTKKLEVMSFDRRYESNVDALGRLIHYNLGSFGLNATYTVTGNTPLVIRESLLPEIIEMGESVIRVSQEIEPPGLYGPFCLETILTPKLEFIVFEISARIVAGTNLYPNGSPYTQLRYKKPMSTGRRIALDIRKAIEYNKLKRVLG